MKVSPSYFREGQYALLDSGVNVVATFWQNNNKKVGTLLTSYVPSYVTKSFADITLTVFVENGFGWGDFYS